MSLLLNWDVNTNAPFANDHREYAASLTAETVGNQFHRLVERGIERAKRIGKPILVSLIEETPLRDAISLFAAAQSITADRFFWSQPGEQFALVGLGVAHVINPVGARRFRQTANARQTLMTGAIIEHCGKEGWRGLPGVSPLFFGGFAFDPQRQKSGLWAAYGDGRLVLPRLLYSQLGKQAYFVLSAVVDGYANADHETDSLLELFDHAQNGFPYRRAEKANEKRPAATTRELRPAEDWQAEVRNAATLIGQDETLKKVVLARSVELVREGGYDLPAALQTLSTNYPDCYVYAVAQGEQCFIGATPERLMQLVDGEFQTMSLAGSTRRGVTPEEDATLGAELLRSHKDLDEHALVVRSLVEMLRDYTDELNLPTGAALLKLKNVQHLWTPINGTLSADYTLLDLVERLHPTPAVGGRPQAESMAFLREHEGMDRGWYAAPIGWIDGNGAGEFAVALRCALVKGDTATLFAGCGIVADSDPEREYAESALKLRPMLNALTGI